MIAVVSKEVSLIMLHAIPRIPLIIFQWSFHINCESKQKTHLHEFFIHLPHPPPTRLSCPWLWRKQLGFLREGMTRKTAPLLPCCHLLLRETSVSPPEDTGLGRQPVGQQLVGAPQNMQSTGTLQALTSPSSHHFTESEDH